MQIVLKRIAKKKTYTIGRLYILKDEDVKKRTAVVQAVFCTCVQIAQATTPKWSSAAP